MTINQVDLYIVVEDRQNVLIRDLSYFDFGQKEKILCEVEEEISSITACNMESHSLSKENKNWSCI